MWIYINIEYEQIQYYLNGGFFAYNLGTIQNLTLDKGKIKTVNLQYTGGICGNSLGKIIKCINKVDVIASEDAGGILGRGNGIVEKCGNEGNIISIKASVGGIFGKEYTTGLTIKECYNAGIIEGTDSARWNWRICRYLAWWSSLYFRFI